MCVVGHDCMGTVDGYCRRGGDDHGKVGNGSRDEMMMRGDEPEAGVRGDERSKAIEMGRALCMCGESK